MGAEVTVYTGRPTAARVHPHCTIPLYRTDRVTGRLIISQIFYRPCVAGAVLQTPASLINLLTMSSFLEIWKFVEIKKKVKSQNTSFGQCISSIHSQQSSKTILSKK